MVATDEGAFVIILKYAVPFALLALLGTAPRCPAEDVTVRVLSAKNGRPIVEREVQLVGFPVSTPGKAPASSFERWARTDAGGAAIFHIDPPLPAKLGVGGNMSAPGIDWCSPALYDAPQVFQSGISISRCPHRDIKKLGIHPKPGEIIIWVGEYTWLERVLWLPWPD